MNDQQRSAQSERMRKQWADPEWRATMRVGRKAHTKCLVHGCDRPPHTDFSGCCSRAHQMLRREGSRYEAFVGRFAVRGLRWFGEQAAELSTWGA